MDEHWGENFKRRFELKGRKSEEVIHELAYRSFLQEWCYPNPRWPNGKEICDLLVSFDKTVLLFQIKDLVYTGNAERYIREAFDAPIRQLLGAERKLRLIKEPISLTSASGFVEQFSLQDDFTIHRLAVALGQADVDLPVLQIIEDKPIHMFDSDMGEIVTALDTISDFCDYLSNKERLLEMQGPKFILGAEKDLLADYLFHGRSFDHLKDVDEVIYQDGIFEELSNRPEYRAKKQEDKVSYLWDHFIDISRTSPEPDYRIAAREFSRLTRLQRRMAAQTFLNAAKSSVGRPNGLRRVWTWKGSGKTFVFLFAPPEVSREARKETLKTACFIARDHWPKHKQVLGISTQAGLPKWAQYEFVYFQADKWTAEDHAEAIRVRRETGIFAKIEQFTGHLEEYPTQEVSHSNASAKVRSGHGQVLNLNRKIGRNDLCPCGSGKKYKRCHGSA